MAGLAIEFKKLLNKNSLSSLLTALGYSTVISSGSWLVAIAFTFIFSYIAAKITGNYKKMIVYLTYVTYSIALSLIISSPFQLLFSRFIADQLYKKQLAKIFPNYVGAISLTIIISTLFAIPISIFLFKGLPLIYKLIFVFTIPILGAIWVSTSLLSGLKKYIYIFFTFFFSYVFSGALLIYLYKYEIFYEFFAFYIGQVLLLVFFIVRIIIDFPSTKLMSFDFLKKENAYYSLAFTGLFYNLGIWVDKFLYWFNKETSQAIFSNIRNSFVYDFPVTLAYLTIVPGLAVLFLKVESDFAEYYSKFQVAIVGKSRLDQIYFIINKMIYLIRNIIFSILFLQTIFVSILIIYENKIFKALNVSLLYIPIFNVLMVGSALLLLFIAIFVFLSYLDRRQDLLLITFTFFITNLLFTVFFMNLGIVFSGYGYTISLLIASLLGLFYLRRSLNEILYWVYIGDYQLN